MPDKSGPAGDISNRTEPCLNNPHVIDVCRVQVCLCMCYKDRQRGRGCRRMCGHYVMMWAGALRWMMEEKQPSIILQLWQSKVREEGPKGPKWEPEKGQTRLCCTRYFHFINRIFDLIYLHCLILTGQMHLQKAEAQIKTGIKGQHRL